MGFALSKMEVTTSAFANLAMIPERFTGEGEDVSPSLTWTGAPAETKSFAVICHDPDAPLVNAGGYGFVHWVLYNLSGNTTRLDEGTRVGTSGTNDFGSTGYGGPLPPPGHGVHHYFFWVLALNADLALDAGLTLRELLERVEPHLIAMNRIVGSYRRG